MAGNASAAMASLGASGADYSAEIREQLERIDVHKIVAANRRIVDMLPAACSDCVVFAVSKTIGTLPRVAYMPAVAHTAMFYHRYHACGEAHDVALGGVVYVVCANDDINAFVGAPLGVLHAANWLVRGCTGGDAEYVAERSLDGDYMWVLMDNGNVPFKRNDATRKIMASARGHTPVKGN